MENLSLSITHLSCIKFKKLETKQIWKFKALFFSGILSSPSSRPPSKNGIWGFCLWCFFCPRLIHLFVMSSERSRLWACSLIDYMNDYIEFKFQLDCKSNILQTCLVMMSFNFFFTPPQWPTKLIRSWNKKTPLLTLLESAYWSFLNHDAELTTPSTSTAKAKSLGSFRFYPMRGPKAMGILLWETSSPNGVQIKQNKMTQIWGEWVFEPLISFPTTKHGSNLVHLLKHIRG